MNDRSPNLSSAIARLERMQKAEGRRALTAEELAAFEARMIPQLMENMHFSEQEAREFFADIRSTQEQMYTRFENPIWLSRAIDLTRKIDAVLTDRGAMADHKKIVFGTLRTGDVNGMAVEFNNPEYQIIVLDDGVFGYANLLSKAILMAFPLIETAPGQFEISSDRTSIRKRIDGDPMLFVRLAELILNYLVNGDVFAAPQYFAPISYVNIHGAWLDAMEYFVLGHEYGHCRLGHFQKPAQIIPHQSFDEVAFKWQQEHEADAFGLGVLFDCMGHDPHRRQIAYAAVEAFFAGLELIHRSLAKFADIEPLDEGSPSHPPVAARRKALREALREHVDAAEYEASIAFADGVHEIVDIMVPQLDKEIVTQRANGLKLHSKWLA